MHSYQAEMKSEADRHGEQGAENTKSRIPWPSALALCLVVFFVICSLASPSSSGMTTEPRLETFSSSRHLEEKSIEKSEAHDLQMRFSFIFPPSS